MARIDEVKSQLRDAGLGRTDLWTAGQELLALVTALGDAEVIESAVAGEFAGAKGYVVATADRVLFVSGNAMKQQSESLLYDKITSVQAETKRLVVYTSGNSAALEKIVNATSAKRFADFVRARLAAEPKSAAAPATGDIAAQIEQLGRLRDQGLLSDEEFQTQKLKLLERL